MCKNKDLFYKIHKRNNKFVKRQVNQLFLLIILVDVYPSINKKNVMICNTLPKTILYLSMVQEIWFVIND